MSALRCPRQSIIGLVALGLFALLLAQPAGAARVDELREELETQSQRIAEIQAEIEQYQSQLDDIGQERRSLENAIEELDVSRQKLTADIRLTNAQIANVDLEIEELGLDISDKERRIGQNNEALAETLRRMNEAESASIIETFLAHESISDVWNDLAAIGQFQSFVRSDLEKLANLKDDLEDRQSVSRAKRHELAQLRAKLAGQREALNAAREQEAALLAETRNEEARYQEILEEKRAEQEAFEAELRLIESQLEYELDPSKIPAAGEGILLWPFDSAYMQNCQKYTGELGNPFCLTQYFGNTEFAQRAAYKGQGHNGIDFRAPVGTPIRAALGGEVVEVNHGVARWCQYGKWVLVEHGNGLSTLYAHLSVVSVSAGERVTTGDIVGFAGNTGYSFGPHLHFTVYVSEAVSLKQYTCNSGQTVTVPVAPFSGYLNPLSYL